MAVRVALLRSDDPHHVWLEAQLAGRLDLVGAVVEPGAAQQARLWRRRRWVDGVARAYQGRRQRLTGRAAHRRRYFELSGDGAPRPTRPVPAFARVEVDWINDERAQGAVKTMEPDVVVVCGTTIVERATLAGAPAINVHAGHLPRYRGNHGIYFAFERGDFEHIGASLHLVTPELDGGELIEFVRPELFPHDNDEHLYCRSVEAAVLRLCDLLEEHGTGATRRSAPQDGDAETFRHRDRTPRRELRLWLRRRLGRHPVPRLPAVEPEPWQR